MNRQNFRILYLTLGALLTACGGDAPTAPQASGEPTTLQVEPSAPVSTGDPAAMVVISVEPSYPGGRLAIEVCADRAGEPIPAAYSAESPECEGRWVAAVDGDGQNWSSRAWSGSLVVRFARTANQEPLLYRASYFSAGHDTLRRDVIGCRWVVAEMSDVGVRCSSDEAAQLLPRVTGRAGASVAE